MAKYEIVVVANNTYTYTANNKAAMKKILSDERRRRAVYQIYVNGQLAYIRPLGK